MSSTAYATMEDFAGKASVEGGVAEFVLYYGISEKDLGPDLKKFWPLIEKLNTAYEELLVELDEAGFSDYVDY